MPLNITDGATVSKPNGVDFLDEYAGHVTTLYETGSRPLTSIGGTGDVVTATMAVDLTDAGLVDGLCVSLTWGAANTGSVTLAINGGSPIPVVDAAGDALTPDTLSADLTSVLRYTAGEWRIISSLGVAGGGSGPSYEILTTSQTWDRPTGYADDTMVLIELWGAGGGGGRPTTGQGGGGGGGGYASRLIRIADIPTSVLVTIGQGGTPATGVGVDNATAGGDSTFGTILTAYGGGKAGLTAGGGGGGLVGKGGNGTGSTPGTAGPVAAGAGAAGAGAAGHATGAEGGGGGAASGVGGSSFRGGGGAGGTPGVSVFGGNGGICSASPTPGTAPGGGGGGGTLSAAAQAGARGECRITIFG